MKKKPELLILGIGNSLRGDDGAGPWICTQLQKEDLAGVTIETAMQLFPEHLQQFLAFDAILIVDASVEATELNMVRIENLHPGTASSHHQDLPTLVALGKQLFGKNMALYACHIPAGQFEIGQLLSERTAAHAHQALHLIREWIAMQQHQV